MPRCVFLGLQLLQIQLGGRLPATPVPGVLCGDLSTQMEAQEIKRTLLQLAGKVALFIAHPIDLPLD